MKDALAFFYLFLCNNGKSVSEIVFSKTPLPFTSALYTLLLRLSTLNLQFEK